MIAQVSSTRRRTIAGAVVVLLAALAVVLVVAVRGGGGSVPRSAPYHDPAATGAIGLCDRAGHQVRTGSTTAMPFVWRAEGVTAASGAVAGTGRTATLYVYQPRAGTLPEEWSGQALTDASRYDRPAHPTAAATYADVALDHFLAGYPTQDNGFVQLRLYLGSSGAGTQTARYDALNLYVKNHTWHAIGGTTVDCATARAESLETAAGIGTSPSAHPTH